MTRKIHTALPDDFAERAPHMSTPQIEREWKIGTPKAHEWLARIGIRRAPRKPKPMPDGFAEAAETMGASALERHFNLTRYDVSRMRKALGCISRRERLRVEIPDNFAGLATQISTAALADRYGVSRRLIGAWRARLGIAPPTPRYHRDGSLKVRSPNACSVEDMAADHLRKTAPVHRCGPDGRFNLRGSHWRYGTVVIDRDELMARAQRKGWNPDGWRSIGHNTGGEATHP